MTALCAGSVTGSSGAVSADTFFLFPIPTRRITPMSTQSALARKEAPAQTATLLSPYRLGDLELANRMVMAPMTRSRALAHGVPNPLAATYYGQRAGAGLIV